MNEVGQVRTESMGPALTRRQFTLLAGGVIAGAGLAELLQACGGGSTQAGPAIPRSTAAAEMQLVWWGAEERARRTNQVIDLFQQKYPKYRIAGSYGAFDPYFDKLNTQVAAGAMPDIVQMDMRFIGEYTNKKLLLDLSPYTPDPIGLADFDNAQLSQGKIKRGLYGISLGGNVVAALLNETLLDAAGAKYPKDATYADFADWAVKLAPALPKGVYPIQSTPGIIEFEYFVRQRGRTLYTADGKVGFTKQDAQEWLAYWADLRKRGAAAPADLAAAGRSSSATELISTGKAVIRLGYQNFLDGYQKFTKGTLALHGYPAPAKGQKSGYYVKASQLFSISAKTASPYQACQFVNLFINDPQAVKILLVERGVPGSAKVQEQIKPLLTAGQQAQVDYVAEYSKVSLPKNELDPPGAGAVGDAAMRADDSVGLKGTSVASAADTFMSEAQKAVS